MNIFDFLAPSNVRADVATADKSKLLSELARAAATSLELDSDRIAAALLKREELGSTGIGGGVAIPHARFQQAKKPFGMLIRLKKAIAFDAVDGKPVDVIFLLLLPEGAGGEQQVGALATIARKLRNLATTAALRRARNGAEMYRILTAD